MTRKKKPPIQNETVKAWLGKYLSKKTQATHRRGLEKFLKWYKKPVEDLIACTSDEVQQLCVDFQRDMKAEGISQNSIVSYTTSIRSLFNHLNKELKFSKGQLLNVVEGQEKHCFSNGDLKTMWSFADVQGKAILSVGTSLGWGISDVTSLKRDFIKQKLEEAKKNNGFAFFKHNRGKTGAKSLGILNPLACEWLEKYFKLGESETIFEVNKSRIQQIINELGEKSGVSGNISFHGFRSWVMISMNKAGFTEFEQKMVVGKKIPVSDSTYLNGLRESIKTKYIEAYPKYFNITNQTQNPTQQKEINDLKSRILQLEEYNELLIRTLDSKLGIKIKELYQETS